MNHSVFTCSSGIVDCILQEYRQIKLSLSCVWCSMCLMPHFVSTRVDTQLTLLGLSYLFCGKGYAFRDSFGSWAIALDYIKDTKSTCVKCAAGNPSHQSDKCWHR